MVSELAATLPQITNQFLATIELRPRRLVAIEIADQTNSERDVVQIIAVHMSAVDLSPPAITHFDLPVASGCSVADDEVIRQSILHVAHMFMVVIEHTCVALPRAAVVHHDHLPAGITAIRRCAIDLRAH